MNTSSLSGLSGYLDFQFNPGPASDPAYANLSGFATDGSLIPPPDNAGNASGTLPGAVTISNDTVYNDYNEGFTFNSFFDIFVTLDIPTLSGKATSGDKFILGLYQPNDSDEFITPDSDPGLVEIELDNNGNPTVTNYSLNSEASVSQTPEPGSILLLMSGLGLIAFARRRISVLR